MSSNLYLQYGFHKVIVKYLMLFYYFKIYVKFYIFNSVMQINYLYTTKDKLYWKGELTDARRRVIRNN